MIELPSGQRDGKIDLQLYCKWYGENTKLLHLKINPDSCLVILTEHVVTKSKRKH